MRGYVPDAFGSVVIVPVPKSDGSKGAVLVYFRDI